MTYVRRTALYLMLLFCASAFGADLTVHIDAREVARRHLQTHETLAVRPGRLVLVYPKWIPSEHAPDGPLGSIIGLQIFANGQSLEWRRDPYEAYALAVTVPAGVHRLDIVLDSGMSVEGSDSGDSPESTAQLAIIRWNEFVLLPKGTDASTVESVGSLRIPRGWTAACALGTHPGEDGALEFETVSLAQLIDSPVQIGRFVRRIDIPGSPPNTDIRHSISIAADTAAATEVPADFAQTYGRLVAEAGALFGSRHYRQYVWLLSLSDQFAYFGEEHHESSDNRLAETVLKDTDGRKLIAGLLGHEYVHSWNGKFRRPQGLLSPDYLKPMDDSLLWVYEGLTQYWGDVLPARAGLMTQEDYRERIAVRAGHFDVSSGPRWRPLADTAAEAPKLYHAPQAWSSARRDVDFYFASVFLWLDVDSQLRTQSNGKVALDDFMRQFYSGDDGNVAVKPYVEKDLYKAFGAIAPGDWRGTIRKHLDVPDTTALLNALKQAGWQLSYSAEKNTFLAVTQKVHKSTSLEWSIGLNLDEKGGITDVIEGGAAALAGASPGMMLVAVNERKFTPDILEAAIAAAQLDHKPIELLVENDNYYRALSVPYFNGPRYPHLTRIVGSPDILTAVLTARAQ
jgi:predicted metalloprotease with PDZ domain